MRRFFLASMAALATGQASAAGQAMAVQGTAFAPPAFSEFCRAERALCTTAGRTRVVELTPDRRRQLVEVNRSVNGKVRERSDLATVGKADDWRVPARYGDCEDFAILKKKRLLELGWPASTLLLTVGRAGNEGHAVLTVRTDEGDLILDNRTTKIRNWTATPYRYFARQGQGGGREWRLIAGATNATD